MTDTARLVPIFFIALGCTVEVKGEPDTEDGLPSWCERNAFESDIRGVHSSTNNGVGFYTVRELRSNNAAVDQYLEFVKRVNANWVGISIALQYDSALDTELSRAPWPIENDEPEHGTPTYSDEDLHNIMKAIQAFEVREKIDLHVYWTVALEPSPTNPEGCHGQERDMMGWAWADAVEHGAASPSECTGEPGPLYEPDEWFWGDEDDPNVVAFFDSYASHLEHFASLAEAEGVEMLSIGTESGGLFRSSWFDDSAYPTRLQELVGAVRTDAGYTGHLTYDMLSSSFVDNGDGNRAHYLALWDDVDFDIIGVSAYFQLLATAPAVDDDIGVEDYEDGWDRVFEEHLSDVARDHDQPIVFLEYGYTTDYRAGNEPDEHVGEPRDVVGGVDIGEVAQSRIHTAFHNRRNTCNDIVEGVFAWGDNFAPDLVLTTESSGKGIGIRRWTDSSGEIHTLSEHAFSAGYSSWR